MNTWLNYMLEANAGLLLFLLLYKLLLRSETQFTFRRFYLLAGLILSMVVPLITIPTEITAIPTLSQAIPEQWFDRTEVASTTVPEQITPINYLSIFVFIYSGVVLLLLMRLLFQFTRLFLLIRRFKSSGRIIEIDDPSFFAFSFMQYIFISQAFGLSEGDKERIIRHEEVHRKKLHSIDIFVIELVQILFWFNPFLRHYKHELSVVHEFEADATSVQPGDVDDYCSLLAKAAISSANLSLVNHFNSSLTLKRITMMRTIKKKIRQWKTFFILVFGAAFFVVVSCQDQIVAEMQTLSETTTILGDFPAHLHSEVQRIQLKHPGVPLAFVEAESSNAEKLRKYSAESVLYLNVRKDKDLNGNVISDRIEMIVRTDGAVSKLGDISKSEDNVFLVVEEPASPVGGITSFYEKLSAELRMPEEAWAKGIGGKVFVELIVEPDGTTSDHKVIKGIGLGCDEEAVRAVTAVNIPWNPAKQRGVPVRQRYVLPVTFMPNPAIEHDATQSSAPQKVEPLSENEVFLVVENSARPVGGMDALYAQISSKLKMPAEAKRKGISGKVFVEFIIEPDGTTSNHKLIKGIGDGCDEEALRVMKSTSTKWEPATQQGKRVRQKYVMPIIFINTSEASVSAQPVNSSKMIVSSRVQSEKGLPIVTGTVTGSDGRPLGGVNLVVAGNTYGTVTDQNGNFRLSMQEDYGEIVLSFIGYQSERIVLRRAE
jgi:TonB family protein